MAQVPAQYNSGPRGTSSAKRTFTPSFHNEYSLGASATVNHGGSIFFAGTGTYGYDGLDTAVTVILTFWQAAQATPATAGTATIRLIDSTNTAITSAAILPLLTLTGTGPGGNDLESALYGPVAEINHVLPGHIAAFTVAPGLVHVNGVQYTGDLGFRVVTDATFNGTRFSVMTIHSDIRHAPRRRPV